MRETDVKDIYQPDTVTGESEENLEERTTVRLETKKEKEKSRKKKWIPKKLRKKEQRMEYEKVQAANTSRHIIEGVFTGIGELFCMYVGYIQYQYGLDALSSVMRAIDNLGSATDIHIFPFTGYTLTWIFSGSVVAALCILCAEASARSNSHYTHGEELGSSQWMDLKKELPAFYAKYAEPFDGTCSGESNMIISQNISISQNWFKTGISCNQIVFGETGSRKTFGFVLPNLLNAQGSYVVSDPSGELYSAVAKYLMDVKGYKIKVLNLVEMGKSNTYNPFRYLLKMKANSDEGLSIEDIRNQSAEGNAENDFHGSDGVTELVTCILDNLTDQDAGKGDQYWRKSAEALMKMLVYYVRDFVEEKSRQNIATISTILRHAKLDENKGGLSLMDQMFENLPEDSMAKKNYDIYCLAPAKTRLSTISTLATDLGPFMDPAVEKLTSSDNIDLLSIGDERTALFVILPQDQTESFNFLATMMYTQLFSGLYVHAQTELPPEQKMRLKYHVRLILDEFKSQGKMAGIAKVASTCRKYNISMTPILQGMSQLKTNYEKDWEEFLANCSVKILLKNNEETTVKYFSEVLLGKTTVTVQSRSESKGNKAGTSISYQQQARELMSMSEIGQMDPDKMIVCISGEKPILDTKYDTTKHPAWKYKGDQESNPEWMFHLEDYDIYNVNKKDSRDLYIRALKINAMAKAAEKISTASPLRAADTGAKTEEEALNNLTPSDQMDVKQMFAKEVAKIRQAAKEHADDPIIFAIAGPVHTSMLPFLAKGTIKKYNKPCVLFANNTNQKKVLFGLASNWGEGKRNVREVMEDSSLLRKLDSNGAMVIDKENGYLCFQIPASDYEKFKNYLMNCYEMF